MSAGNRLPGNFSEISEDIKSAVGLYSSRYRQRNGTPETVQYHRWARAGVIKIIRE